ncbi:MAG: DUF72 domain-containing protein [Chryseolinea sp.]
MEFGKVDPEILNKIDFKLSSDNPNTTRLLKLKKSGNIKPKIFVGCAKWGRKDWVGKIYPPKTKEADFLNHYAKHFNCIELNATFYRMPTVRQIETWKSKVGKDFKFCPKFVDQITHLRRLKNVKELTDEFLQAIYSFKENLGPIFLMPHPQMGYKTLDTIQAFIESLPKDIDLFVELRHPEWFANAEAFENAFNTFEKLKVGSVTTDSSGRRDCVHMRLTTSEAFIRFVGNGLHSTDYTRIDDWVNRIKKWTEEGIRTIYFFMHQHEELHSPELSLYLIQQLNKHCGANIKEPQFVSDNDLFGFVH